MQFTKLWKKEKSEDEKMTRKIQAKRHKMSWHHKGAKGKVAKAKKIAWPVKDRGKKGKTPKDKQWSKKLDIPNSHKVEGYSIDKSPKARLVALRKEMSKRGGGKKGSISTARTLQMVVNLNPDKKSDKVMEGDIQKIAPGWGKK